MKVLADTGGVDKIAITFDEQPEEAPVTAKDVAETWEQLETCRTIEQLEKMMVDHAKGKKIVPALYRRYRGL